MNRPGGLKVTIYESEDDHDLVQHLLQLLVGGLLVPGPQL